MNHKHKSSITTYQDALALKQALEQHGVSVLSETFDMKTSGIYIPRWLGDHAIPHHWEPATGTAHWYFFLRFANGYPDLNVAHAVQTVKQHGITHLARTIRRHKK